MVKKAKILYTVNRKTVGRIFVLPDGKEVCMPNAKHREGELYLTVNTFGETFEIRYGYYEMFERDSGEPIPIYPDFKEKPQYTSSGEPFVTAMQDMCEKAEFKASGLFDECCENCRYFKRGHDLIGICKMAGNQISTKTEAMI